MNASNAIDIINKKQYLEEIAAVKEQHRAARTAIDMKLCEHTGVEYNTESMTAARNAIDFINKKQYLAEIEAVKEQHSAARTAIDTKLNKQTEKPPERKPEGWTGESKGGFGWKEYEYRNADGTTEFREKMAICKGWKCGKEFAHNYDCCKACYEKACTRCGNRCWNPYKPMCKDCYSATNATYGQWRRTKRKGYAFK